jgi:DNA-directed RNA polymerase specialized sigma24 family protein
VPDGDAARVWLYATARRVIANQRRSRRRRTGLEERLAHEAAVAPPAERLNHEAAFVHEVLLLAEWEGLSPAEIGAVLGCLAVTARGQLHRARRRFRAVFDELRTPDRPASERRRLLAKEEPDHV